MKKMLKVVTAALICLVAPATRADEGIRFISTATNLAYGWYSDGKVSSGQSDNLAMNKPNQFKLAANHELDQVISISSNSQAHWMWYSNGSVSNGNVDDLAGLRAPYDFKLAEGYSLDDLITISSNNHAHFAWYKDGKVSMGSSENLASIREPYDFKLAKGYDKAKLVAISSTDSLHFAWYDDGRVSAGDSGNLASAREPYRFLIAEGYVLNPEPVQDTAVDYAKLPVVEQGTWVRFCTEGADCQINIGEQYSVSDSLAKSWSDELETTLSSRLAISTTVGAEVNSGVAKASASTTVEAEIAAGLRAAVTRSRLAESGKTTSLDSQLTCAITLPEGKAAGFYWERSLTIGKEHVTMKTCDLACHTSWGLPPWKPGENLGSCSP